MKVVDVNGSIANPPRLNAWSGLARHLRSDWLRCLLLVLIAVAARAPALNGQLIWDDDYLARDNPFIKSPLLILEAFRHHLFLDSFSAHYRPVQNITFIVDYFLWNDNTYGFHITNVLLHAGSGVLLYFLLKRLFTALLQASHVNAVAISVSAFLVSLVWAVHPVHSAAVDYISGRADSLAFLFAAGAWLLYLRGRQITSGHWRALVYFLAASCGLLAFCSRESALTWLAVIFAYQLLFDVGASRRAKVAFVLASLLVVGAYLALRQLPGEREGPGASSSWSKPVRAVLMLRALGDYGRLMIYPSNLHMERTVVDAANYGTQASWRSSAGTEYLSVGGLAVLGVFGFACSRRTPAQRMRIFGTAWFFIGYLPTSNLLELNATVAEHWLYLPSVGILIFLAGCALDFPVKYRPALSALACAAVIALSVRSAIRSSDWVTPETFFTRTMAAGGTSNRVSVNLGLIYYARGDFQNAEAIFRKVLRITPDYPIARNNLAQVLHRQGKSKEAEEMFAASTKTATESRKVYPRTWMAALNLARVQHSEGNDTAALAALEKARLDYPKVWEIISLESELLRTKDGPRASLPLVEKFAQDNWWHYRAALGLGRLYAEEGNVEKAVTALRHASWLDVHEVDALNLISLVRIRQQRFEEACTVQRRAVSRQPDQPRQYLLLSSICEQMGQMDEARAALGQVARLKMLALAAR